MKKTIVIFFSLIITPLLAAGVNAKQLNSSGLEAAKNINKVLFDSVAYSSKSNVIESLLSQGADVNFRDKNGSSVLGRAIRIGASIRVLTLLIDAGADLNATNDKHEGDTFFHLLARRTKIAGASYGGSKQGNKQEKEYIELANYAFKKGANPDAKNLRGQTPIFYASTGMAEWLLAHGANPNSTISKRTSNLRRLGTTPLMVAASDGNVSKLKLLLANGANPLATDADGFDAACYARTRILDYGYPPYSTRANPLNYIEIEKILYDLGLGHKLPAIVKPKAKPLTGPKDIARLRNEKNHFRCNVKGRIL